MQQVANAINAARLSGEPCDYTAQKALFDKVQGLDDIYAVHKLLLSSNPNQRVGWKVGLNNPEGAFAKLGLGEPFTAPLMDYNLHANNAVIASPFSASGMTAEAEWAFTLAHDLSPESPIMPLDDVIAAVDSIGIAIELASTCLKGASVPWFPMIADYGLCTAVVHQPLFDPKELFAESPDVLSTKQVRLAINGKTACGPVLLNGLNELHRAIRLLLAHGHTLKRGDLIITGAVAKVPNVRQGSSVVATFEHPSGNGRATVSCTIAKPATAKL
eukprot:TRINITY_DN15683_c0_g1_i3.p1 TRINITY_DN15683_c0_g1~~TRINITY_DN15683_c0_g1_i3.p1  ORF type:complete len:296 (+),score=110.55 TRINITY_DN15683_c0_g1_i3:71-889(+)